MNSTRKQTRREPGAPHSLAFSLVEVTIALGLAGFALIVIFGLLPTGLQSFRASKDRMIETHIVEYLTQRAQLANFADIASLTASPFSFTEEGLPTTNAGDTAFTAMVTSSTTPFADASENRPSLVSLIIEIRKAGQPVSDPPRRIAFHMADLGH